MKKISICCDSADTVFCVFFLTHQRELETMFHEDNALVTRIKNLSVVNREFDLPYTLLGCGHISIS